MLEHIYIYNIGKCLISMDFHWRASKGSKPRMQFEESVASAPPTREHWSLARSLRIAGTQVTWLKVWIGERAFRAQAA